MFEGEEMTKDFWDGYEPEPSIRFNTQDALEKAKADRDKPVTPVEYKPVISDAGADSNMLWPDTMYGLLPKGTGKITLHESKPAQQEPVAWVTGLHAGRCVIKTINPAAILPVGIALYTTPPAAQRTWVGLTLEEILETYRGPDGSDYVDYARGIEAKLKERNT
jgi:hypothetical protein